MTGEYRVNLATEAAREGSGGRNHVIVQGTNVYLYDHETGSVLDIFMTLRDFTVKELMSGKYVLCDENGRALCK